MYLSDKELHAKLVTLRKSERELTIELIEHLNEVYDRRLFADFGYSSIIKYLVKELGYSESAAFRRYQALRLTKEVPKAMNMIEKGELNITSASMIQGGLKNLKDKKEVLEKSRNKTTNETHELILEKNPELKKRDIINPISNDESRVHITLEKKTLEKIELLKALSKKTKLDDVLNLALSIAIEKLDITQSRTNKRKYIACKSVPRSTVKKLKLRAKNSCEYPGCDEIYNLEIEHIIPRAKGGGHHIDNLKLYCKTHNQRAAINEFGMNKMRDYLIKKPQ